MKFRNLAICLAALLLCAPGELAAVMPVYCAEGVEDAEEEDPKFEYSIEDGEVCITSFNWQIKHLVIPAEIEGYPVTSIETAGYSWNKYTDLVSLTIPDTVKSIESGSFRSYPNLAEIHFPEGLTDLDRYSFEGTQWMKDRLAESDYVVVNGVLLCASSSLTEAVIPDTVEIIGRSAFYYEPEFIPTLGYEGEEPAPSKSNYPEGLTSAVIPGSVREIRDFAFSGNTKLQEINLPEGLTSIGACAFGYTGLTSVTLPSTMTYLGNDAFYRCSSLENVTLPDGLLDLSSQSFADTPWLDSLEPDENGCLYFNHVLVGISMDTTELVIPEDVVAIGRSACASKSELVSVTLPDTISFIGKGAFHSCTGLKRCDLPDSVTVIDEEAFSGCRRLEGLRLPTQLTKLGERAFSGCTTLTGVTIPGCIEHLGIQVFQECSGLRSVTFAEGVQSVGSQAFASCLGMQEVSIPASLTQIDETAFSSCHAIQGFQLDPENPAFVSQDGILFSKDMTRLVRYPAGRPDTSYTAPETLQSIDNDAFAGCLNLQEIVLPGEMDRIGNRAFADCTYLVSITMPKRVNEYNADALSNCPGITELALPEGVLGVSTGCANLRILHIPKSITQVNAYLAPLEAVYYAGSLADWCRIKGIEGNRTYNKANMHFAEECPIEIEEYDLYSTFGNKVPIPAPYATTCQLPTLGEGTEYARIFGDFARVDETGLVTAGDVPGECIFRIRDGEEMRLARVRCNDYNRLYGDQQVDAYLKANITDDMTLEQKLDAICRYPATFDYKSSAVTYYDMITWGDGNCVASTDLILEQCRRLGMRGIQRNANRDPGASSQHVNALIFGEDGAYYELEAGYMGTAPRSYKVTKRSSLLCYYHFQDQEGITVYQSDDLDPAHRALVIPEQIDGLTVTAIGDGFLKENPQVNRVTIPLSVMTISETAFPGYEGILCGESGSAAEAYARAQGIPFVRTDEVVLGDVTADGLVDASDAARILMAAAKEGATGVSPLTAVEQYGADVTAEGSVDASDAAAVLRYAAAVGTGFSGGIEEFLRR